MALGLILGVTLVVGGLILLCHLSYTNMDGKSDAQDDAENAGVMTGSALRKHNDCPLPLCFFQIAQVANHETWIVACLMSGAAVLVLSMV